MMRLLLLEVAALLTVSAILGYHADAARILSIFPMPAKSHWFAIKPLFLELSRRGHNITLVTCFVENDFPPEWEVIRLPAILPKAVSALTPATMSQLTTVGLYDLLLEMGPEACENVFKEEAVKTLTSSKEKIFDLFIIEYFNHNCLLAIAHKLDIPVIGYSSFGGFTFTTDTVGDPYPLSYIPDAMLPFTHHMTFWERLTNVFIASYARFIYSYYHIPKSDEIVQKHFKDPNIPSISALETKTSLLIVQTHISFSYPRPHLPNVIQTGGMHAQKVKPLPEDLQKLLDAAKDGIIFFSMGSYLKSSDFSAEKVDAFVSVFSKLKQLVLWKWDSENLPGKPPNVITRNWFPQSDLLAHKNIRLFISHGGLQSTLEATSHGVPLVGMPAMAEQRHNVEMSVSAGYAVRLDISNITAQSVEWAVREILENPRYHEKAKEKSRLFHDRAQSGVDTAVYWTEYVLRHKGAPHLRSAALDLAWYELLLLDIIAALLLGVAAVLTVIYFVLKKIYTALLSHNKMHVSKKKKTTKND